jgi:hypothetical protein
MSPAARTLYSQFINRLGQEQWDVDELLAPWYAQLMSHVARLALVMHLTRFAHGDQVDRMVCDEASMQAGITLARWFAQEARRVVAVFTMGHEDQEQSRIIQWVHGRGGLATSRDLCRSNGRRYPTDDSARQALDRLVEKGLGVWVDFPAGKNGGPPYQAFSLGRVEVEAVPLVEEIVPVKAATCEGVPSTSAKIVTEVSPPRKNALWALNAVAPLLLRGCVGQKCGKRNKRRGRTAKRR